MSESVQWPTAFNSMARVWVNVILVSTGLPLPGSWEQVCLLVSRGLPLLWCQSWLGISELYSACPGLTLLSLSH